MRARDFFGERGKCNPKYCLQEFVPTSFTSTKKKNNPKPHFFPPKSIKNLGTCTLFFFFLPLHWKPFFPPTLSASVVIEKSVYQPQPFSSPRRTQQKKKKRKIQRAQFLPSKKKALSFPSPLVPPHSLFFPFN